MRNKSSPRAVFGRIQVPCQWCGAHEWVVLSRSLRKYCSKACARAAHSNPPLPRSCARCGMVFLWRPSPSAVRRGFGRFCSRSCAASQQLLERDQTGARNPAWKGEAAAWKTGHGRARAAYPDLGPCEVCGQVPAVERHHRDGDTLHNSRENVALVCDRCHSHVHALRRTHCPKGHAYDEANTYINKKGSRVCRACRRASVRAWKARRRQG